MNPTPTPSEELAAAFAKCTSEHLVDTIVRLTRKIAANEQRTPNAIEARNDIRRQRDVVKAELVGRTIAPVSAP